MPNSHLKKKENYIWFQRPRLWGIIVSCFWQIFTWVWLNIHTPLFWIQIKGFKCSLLNKQLNFINYLCSSIISVKENHQFKWKMIYKVNKPPLFPATILVAIASGKKNYHQDKIANEYKLFIWQQVFCSCVQSCKFLCHWDIRAYGLS